jgi:hypothetical protein
MIKRLILAGLGAVVILAGLATFAANTAQWVNVTAHIEKEIAVACVDDSVSPPTVTSCAFGTVFPQNVEEKVIEVAISKSFTDQTIKSDVMYWVLWECKLQDPTKLASATNKCLEDPSVGKLDGNIRDYIQVTAGAGCMDPSTFPVPMVNPAKLAGIADGTIDRTVTKKCLYHLKFTPPACEGSYNPNTDPAPAPKVVKCHENTTDKDPQKWDVYTDLGDDFKIQVNGFSFHKPTS